MNATLTETTRRVAAAVNRTRDGLRAAGGARTAEHLLQLVRYPPSHALNLARSAEIFEQTMEALLADVSAGHSYNNISVVGGQCLFTRVHRARRVLAALNDRQSK